MSTDPNGLGLDGAARSTGKFPALVGGRSRAVAGGEGLRALESPAIAAFMRLAQVVGPSGGPISAVRGAFRNDFPILIERA